MTEPVIQVALPVPLNRTFDYKLADDQPIVIGARVKVPFGRQHKIGIITQHLPESDYPLDKIKLVEAIIDQKALWPDDLYTLLLWCSQYYQYPLGDTFACALPTRLRQGEVAERVPQRQWQLTSDGKKQTIEQFKRAPKQAQIFSALKKGPQWDSELKLADIATSALKTLVDKGWVESQNIAPALLDWTTTQIVTEKKPTLNDEQRNTVNAIQNITGFGCHLLEGITGSGKTEVYLTLLEETIKQGKQALILVPEIGLTPQTIARFEQRFAHLPIRTVHSGLNDQTRLNVWLDGRDNQAAIIIGTRSAIFTPFSNLGIIIIDEEHDLSYKQQDTLRYHARDLAIVRAQKLQIPIVLGSATPALETLNHALNGKYQHHRLTTRAGNAQIAKTHLLDIKALPLQGGIAYPLQQKMKQHLDQGNQVMVFLNRRGFSPAVLCHECGWIADCPRCERHYTFHQQRQELHCHHCGGQRRIMPQCEGCGSTQLITAGVGTEQVEEALQVQFPDHKTVRIDRDTTQRKGKLDEYLNGIQENKYQILIGTQMLAKGHHFPNVTLVILLDIDGALFSQDFRAPERLAQLLIQVSGRAGRAEKEGEVWLQTHHPEHPLLQMLIQQGYGEFAKHTLLERKQTDLPPYSFFTLFRAEAHQTQLAQTLLNDVALQIKARFQETFSMSLLGPIPAPIPQRAGRFRWQLIVQAPDRKTLHRITHFAHHQLAHHSAKAKVRWSIDVEPQDLT